jgi:hypothetical protein
LAGYSGTALAAKLGIKPGIELHVVNAPEDYRELVAPLPDGVRFVSKLSSTVDIVHVFSTRKSELLSVLRMCRERLDPTAVVWVSWPKKAAKVPTDITEDTIREVALPLGFVDIKVCAVSDIWSGLKLVVRKELR